MSLLQDIKSGIEEGADREQLDALTKKYPIIADSLSKVEGERDSLATQHQALNAANTALQGKFEQVDVPLRKWESWKGSHWDDEQGKTKEQLAAEQEAVRMKAELDELKGTIDSGTPEDVKAYLDSKGYVSAQSHEGALATLKQEFQTKFDLQSKSLDQALNGWRYMYEATGHLPNQHEKEFGEPFTHKELFAYMDKNNIADPDAAYNQMVSQKRADIQVKTESDQAAAHKQEIEEAEKRGKEQGLREGTMAGAEQGGRLPIDTVGAPADMGHLQKDFLRRASGEKNGKGAEGDTEFENASLGQGVLSRKGYRDYLAKQNA